LLFARNVHRECHAFAKRIAAAFCLCYSSQALEERHRIHAGLVLLINIPYMLFPILLIRRMWPGPPFASPAHEKPH
jgi:hypothetical protein